MAIQDQSQLARQGDPGPAAPSVLAVVVTHDPGPALEETLESLVAQDYPRLSVLVVDAASTEDPTARVLAVAPSATVMRRHDDRGFGAAANVVLEDGPRAALYLFCHDDLALRPDAVSRLVEEVLRSNAAVVGPKVVDWNDSTRLQNVGLAVDKFGVSASIVEDGELDQEQHDAVTDVFAVSGGCTMVRADLFRTIGGYDAGISLRGDDVDLCWRAQLAGARVMVVPSAVVRHHEGLLERRGVDDVRRLKMRHQLRTLLVCTSRTRLVTVLPQAVLLALLEIVQAVVRGRFAQASDVVVAWAWNLKRLREIRRRRKLVRAFRQVSDAELHRMQVRGSVRLRLYLRGQIGRSDGVGGLAASGRHFASSLRSAPNRNALTVFTLLTILVAIGSRHLLTRAIPAVGELQPFTEGTGALLDDWWRGWHTRAMGSSAPAPTAYAFLGLAGIPLLGKAALLRTLLVLAPLPVAAVGMWRLLRPFASRNGAIVGTVVYAANPIPYNAYSRGSWSTLVVYAAAPWILVLLARTLGVRPFHRMVPRGGSLLHRGLGLGLLLAVVGAFVPFVVVLVWVIAVGLVLGSLVVGDGRGLGSLLGGTALASLVAFVLHVPWSLSFLRGDPTWSSFVGPGASGGDALDLGALLRFETGPMGGTFFGWATLVAATFALVLAQGPRLAWTVRCWFVALAAWGLVLLGEQGALDGIVPDPVLPDPGVTLAVAAAAMAVAAALGVAAFESDLRKYRFGWRQLAPASAIVVFVAIVAPLAAAAVDGRWDMPRRSFASTFESLEAEPGEGGARVLWLGDSEVLPLAGFRLDDTVMFTTTDHGSPSFADRWGGPSTTGIPIVRDAVTAAVDGDTSGLGRLLAPFSVRYIVVVEAQAPGDRAVHPAPPTLLRALGSQLDLEPVLGVDPALTIYRNTSWSPMRTALPDNVDVEASGLAGLAATDLSRAEAVLTDVDDDGITASGTVPGSQDVYVSATAAPDWRLEVDGRSVERGDAFGWANAFAVGTGGEASLTYDTPLRRRALLVGQVALWGVAWVALGSLRNRRPEPVGRGRHTA
jgi:GT2 family glycosyltransferase